MTFMFPRSGLCLSMITVCGNKRSRTATLAMTVRGNPLLQHSTTEIRINKAIDMTLAI